MSKLVTFLTLRGRCYKIKPDALIKTLQRIVYPFTIQYDIKCIGCAYRLTFM